MKINQAGIDLIKSFEGLRLKAYHDVIGVLTIGYGHTGDDIRVGQEITEEQAESTLHKDLAKFEDGVTKLLKVPVTDNQFAALVAFAFNLGLGNLAQSTLLRCINMKNLEQAPNEFLRWDRAAGNVVAGLTRRRKAERELFLKS